MKKIYILLIGLFSIILLSGCAVSLAADVTPPPDYQAPVEQEPILQETAAPILPPDISGGKIIYLEKCEPCHGEKGMGDGSQSSQLPVAAAPIGNKDFAKDKKPIDWFEIITNGNIENFMPGFQSLDDRERWNVTAYVLTLSSTYNESEIQKVFKENCESCHAIGNSAGISDFSDFGQLIDQSQNEIVGLIQNGNSVGMPSFQNVLSEEDIDSLAYYVRVLGFKGSLAYRLGMTPHPASFLLLVFTFHRPLLRTTPSPSFGRRGISGVRLFGARLSAWLRALSLIHLRADRLRELIHLFQFLFDCLGIVRIFYLL